MLWHIIAVGKISGSAEHDLVLRYQHRLGPRLKITEVSDHKLQSFPTSSRVRRVVLDERGLSLDSASLADRLGTWQDDGAQEIQFFIGGADGHTPTLRESADLLLSFGTATWPHLLVRAMLAEQLYRAQCILTSHPYHRGH